MTFPFRPAALLASCLMAVSFGTQAQTTTAPSASPVTVPASDCTNPGAAPLDKGGADMTRFVKRVDEYKVCINKYVAATRAKYTEYDEQARAYSDASNKAVDEYNTYIVKLNESQKAK